MKKTMIVKLSQYRGATATQGQVYSAREWEIKFDDSGSNPATPISVECYGMVKEAFPPAFEGAVDDLLSEDSSNVGGSIRMGEWTLEVSIRAS